MAEDPTKPVIVSTVEIKREPPANPAGGRHFGLDAETAKYRETIKPIASEERKG